MLNYYDLVSDETNKDVSVVVLSDRSSYCMCLYDLYYFYASRRTDNAS
jgi:hypothetical protein